jgi:hypothetical protein
VSRGDLTFHPTPAIPHLRYRQGTNDVDVAMPIRLRRDERAALGGAMTKALDSRYIENRAAGFVTPGLPRTSVSLPMGRDRLTRRSLVPLLAHTRRSGS